MTRHGRGRLPEPEELVGLDGERLAAVLHQYEEVETADYTVDLSVEDPPCSEEVSEERPVPRLEPSFVAKVADELFPLLADRMGLIADRAKGGPVFAAGSTSGLDFIHEADGSAKLTLEDHRIAPDGTVWPKGELRDYGSEARLRLDAEVTDEIMARLEGGEPNNAEATDIMEVLVRGAYPIDPEVISEIRTSVARFE